jgi:hypothetical protein
MVYVEYDKDSYVVAVTYGTRRDVRWASGIKTAKTAIALRKAAIAKGFTDATILLEGDFLAEGGAEGARSEAGEGQAKDVGRQMRNLRHVPEEPKARSTRRERRGGSRNRQWTE